jgi:hypothetical protein
MVPITSKYFFFGPTHPFFFLTHTSPLQMATTRNQDLQTSINQAHVSISHLTSQIDSTNSRIDNLETNLTTQLTSLQSVVNQLLNHPMGPSSSAQPDVVDSSQSLHFHSNSFHHEPHLPRVEVNKFDGSNPTGWVTQMEHYFSLHGITDELAKLRYVVLYLDPEHCQWWQWRKNSRQGYISWTQFVAKLYARFDTDTHYLGRLTKLKQSCTVEDFITTFEHLAFRTEGMSDAFFRECFISGLKDEI